MCVFETETRMDTISGTLQQAEPAVTCSNLQTFKIKAPEFKSLCLSQNKYKLTAPLTHYKTHFYLLLAFLLDLSSSICSVHPVKKLSLC